LTLHISPSPHNPVTGPVLQPCCVPPLLSGKYTEKSSRKLMQVLQPKSANFHCKEIRLRYAHIYGVQTPNSFRWRNTRQTGIPFL